MDSYKLDGCYKKVKIVLCPSDKDKFKSLRTQFFQALHGNLTQGFPSTKFLCVLNKDFWPNDPLQRAIYGETELSFSCKEFRINSVEAANIVMEYSMYKKDHIMKSKLANLCCC